MALDLKTDMSIPQPLEHSKPVFHKVQNIKVMSINESLRKSFLEISKENNCRPVNPNLIVESIHLSHKSESPEGLQLEQNEGKKVSLSGQHLCMSSFSLQQEPC